MRREFVDAPAPETHSKCRCHTPVENRFNSLRSTMDNPPQRHDKNMSNEETADIVNVVEKSRVEEDGTGRGPWKEKWTEVEIQSPEDKISENMAEFLWHEFGIEAEQKGLEVMEDEQ